VDDHTRSIDWQQSPHIGAGESSSKALVCSIVVEHFPHLNSYFGLIVTPLCIDVEISDERPADNDLD